MVNDKIRMAVIIDNQVFETENVFFLKENTVVHFDIANFSLYPATVMVLFDGIYPHDAIIQPSQHYLIEAIYKGEEKTSIQKQAFIQIFGIEKKDKKERVIKVFEKIFWFYPLELQEEITSLVLPTKCPSCGTEIESHWQFCPYCGTRLN